MRLQLSPRGDLVYVRVAKAEEQTMAGVLLPGSSKQRPTSGQVHSVGDGRLPNGCTMEFTVKPGDEVRKSCPHPCCNDCQIGPATSAVWPRIVCAGP